MPCTACTACTACTPRAINARYADGDWLPSAGCVRAADEARLALQQARTLFDAALAAFAAFAASKEAGYKPTGIPVLALTAADRRRAHQVRAGPGAGAVGASGGTGEEDEAICKAGVSAAGLVSG